MRHKTVFGALATGLIASLGVGGGLAAAQSGGVGGIDDSSASSTTPPTDRTYQRASFGSRDLRMGMRGDDVKTLNWVLRGLALSTPYHGDFQQPTDSAVRGLQRSRGVRSDGVVHRPTRKALASAMANQRATWYGPGLWGNRTACGKTLRPKTIGVAHRKLPCGTRVVLAYRGRWVRAKVIDRGPYRRGYRWDLTKRLAKRLGVLAAGTARLKTTATP